MKSWGECHAAGMTAREAAEARGMNESSAYDWSRRHGHRWAFKGTAVPVRVRGVDYPSLRVAGEALGVNPSTICHHLRVHGHADHVGMKMPAQRKKPTYAKPIKIGKHTFATRQEAAFYLNIGVSTLRHLLKHDPQRVMSYLLARDAGWAYLPDRRAGHWGRKPGTRGPASIKALGLLRQGKSRAEVRNLTGLSHSHVARLAVEVREERAAA